MKTWPLTSLAAGEIEETQARYLTDKLEERHHWWIVVAVRRELLIEVCSSIIPR